MANTGASSLTPWYTSTGNISYLISPRFSGSVASWSDRSEVLIGAHQWCEYPLKWHCNLDLAQRSSEYGFGCWRIWRHLRASGCSIDPCIPPRYGRLHPISQTQNWFVGIPYFWVGDFFSSRREFCRSHWRTHVGLVCGTFVKVNSISKTVFQ
jgi:hypothetical protein